MKLPFVQPLAPTAPSRLLPPLTAAPPVPHFAPGAPCTTNTSSHQCAATSHEPSLGLRWVPPNPFAAQSFHGPTSEWGERRIMRKGGGGRATSKKLHTATNSNSVRARSRFRAMYLERSWRVVNASMGTPRWATACNRRGRTMEGRCRVGAGKASTRPGVHPHVASLRLRLDAKASLRFGCVSNNLFCIKKKLSTLYHYKSLCRKRVLLNCTGPAHFRQRCVTESPDWRD